jgi:hypothetical protein
MDWEQLDPAELAAAEQAIDQQKRIYMQLGSRRAGRTSRQFLQAMRDRDCCELPPVLRSSRPEFRPRYYA